MSTFRYAPLGFVLILSAACTMAEKDTGDDDQPTNPAPACKEDSDCSRGSPSACHAATCDDDGTCSYEFTCASGQVCNASGECETPTMPPPPPTTGNGKIACAEDGVDTVVTVSNGILRNLFDDPTMFTPAWLRLGYGLDDYRPQPWTGDGTYTMRMPYTTAVFTFYVQDTAGGKHWFNVAKFDASGICGRQPDNGAFTHAVRKIGDVNCQVVLYNGERRRKIEFRPDPAGNGLIAGTVTQGSPVSSPEYFRIGTTRLGWFNQTVGQLPWGANGAYTNRAFYLDPNDTEFNGFIADDNDAASGSDTIQGGDWIDITRWTVSNTDGGQGGSNCRVGGGSFLAN